MHVIFLRGYIYIYTYTGRFIMFSVITIIYNKKTKGRTLMELFTATGKLEKLFLTTRDVGCVHHWWHGTHRYDIQVLATHRSTWVHRYSWLLQWSVPLGQRGHVGGSFAYFARNARCTVTTDLLCDIPTHTKRLLLPERPFSHCIHSHRLAAEMWTTMQNNLLGEKMLSRFFYLYRFCKYVSYGFPIINCFELFLLSVQVL
jgi:hypothetical protein